MISPDEAFEVLLSPERAEAAVRRRASFNLIHLKTMIKVDLFVFTDTPLARQEMLRRQILPIPGESGLHLPIASPEDTILQKLLWYREGRRTAAEVWRTRSLTGSSALAMAAGLLHATIRLDEEA